MSTLIADYASGSCSVGQLLEEPMLLLATDQKQQQQTLKWNSEIEASYRDGQCVFRHFTSGAVTRVQAPAGKASLSSEALLFKQSDGVHFQILQHVSHALVPKWITVNAHSVAVGREYFLKLIQHRQQDMPAEAKGKCSVVSIWSAPVCQPEECQMCLFLVLNHTNLQVWFIQVENKWFLRAVWGALGGGLAGCNLPVDMLFKKYQEQGKQPVFVTLREE